MAMLATTPAEAALRFAQGQFDGSGASFRSVSGIGFRPDVVIVVGENDEPAMLRSSTMGPSIAKPIGPADEVLTDRIISLDADGFTVGSDASVNASDLRYHWVALKGSPGLLHLGSYSGDGVDDRVIDVGFSPEYVIVMAENNDEAMQRFAGQAFDASLPFDNTDAKADRIQDFTPTGFQVGKHNTVNENGRPYHWVALAPSSLTHETGSYVGDGTSGRTIGGLAFGPEAVLVKADAGERTFMRTQAMTAPTSIPLSGGGPLAETILDLLPDGFVVGSEKPTNESNKTIHWISFRDTPEADLSLSAAVDDAAPAEGDTVVFELDVENLGPSDADAVVLEGNLDPGLTLLSSAWTAGSYDTGIRRWNLGTLPAGDTASLSLRTLVDVGTRGETLEFSARTVSLDQIDPVAANDSARVAISVADSADLALDLSLSSTEVDEGEELQVLARVDNQGPGRAEAVTVAVDLPAGLDYISDQPDVGIYDSQSGVWTVGAMSPGSSGELVLRARAGSGSAGSTITIGGIAAAATPDPSAANDEDAVDLRVRATDLAVRVTPSQAEAYVGDAITWTVEVTNLGPDDAADVTATVTPSLLLGETSHDVTQGSYSSLTDVWSVGAIAVGDTARLELNTVALAGSAGGLLEVAAAVESSSVDPNDGNDAVTANLSVLAADLGVELTANRNSANPGDPIVWTVTARNEGPDDATATEVILTLPAGVSFQGAAPGRGSFDEGSGTWTLGPLAAGEAIDLVVTVRIDPGTEGSTLSSTATISAPETDLVGDNDLATDAIRVRSVDLVMTKVVDDVAPDEGDLITYTLGVENLGPDDAGAVVVTDVLPAETTFVSAVPSQGVYDDATGIWSIGAIAEGQTFSMALIATVDAGTAGAEVVNEARITSSDEVDVDPGNDVASASLTVFSADLSIAQSVDVSSPNEGDTVTFTLDLENLGPNDVSGVQVSSPSAAGLSFASATPTQGSYDSGTGLWTVGALTAGQTASLDLATTVDAGTAGLSLTQVSTIVASSLSDPVADNDVAETTLTVFSADLSAVLTADRTQPNVGETVVLTAVVENLGPNLATGITVAESLATGLTVVSALPSAGSFDIPTGSWSLPSLAAGTSDTLTIAATVDGGTAGQTLGNSLEIVGSDLVDPDPANDRTTLDLMVSASDLQLTLSADATLVDDGDPVEWELSLRNLGPSPLDSARVDVALDAALSVEGWSSTRGDFDSPSGTWTTWGVGVDSTVTLRLSTRVGDAPAGSALGGTATLISSRPVDPAASNGVATASVRVASADLAVDKRAATSVVEIGETASFTISVVNRGPDLATGVALVDSLPAGLGPSGWSADRGTYDPVSGRWTIGELAVGTSARLELQTTVEAGTSGQTLTNVARVVDVDQADPLPVDGSDLASVSVRTADLALSAETEAASVALGDTAKVTFRLKNRGPGRATGARIALVVDDGLLPVSTSVDGVWDVLSSEWSPGALASGATAALTVELAVLEAVTKAQRGAEAHVLRLDQSDPDSDNDSARAEYEIIEPIGGLELRITQSGASLVPGAAPVEVARLRISNRKILPDTLRALHLDDVSIGAGSTQQMDASWQPLTLEVLDQDRTVVGVSVQDGAARFTDLELAVPAGGQLELSLLGGASLVARDGDALDLALSEADGLAFASGDTARRLEDSDTSATYPVDGLAADQLRMVRLDNEGLRSGVDRQKVLEFVLPANGYQSDVLQKLNLVQYGTARASTAEQTLDIAALEAWADDGSGGLETDLDTRLGTFSFTGDRWELTGLSHVVPPTGSRIFVTADIEEDAGVGRTVELGIPGPPDPGVGMASDNDGPVDRAPESATAQSIIAVDRITVAASAGRTGAVHPGARSVSLLDLVLSNSYAGARTLRRLEVENATIGSGTQAELDAGFERLTLRLDGNGDGGLDDLETDPVLATGAFTDGHLVFDALSVPVAGESSIGLFVEVRVSTEVADGDRLGLRLAGPSSVDFVESSTVSGTWPVVSPTRAVDGMVASQVSLGDFGSDTLGALEGPALAFDFTVPANGYRDDVLQGLRLENDGTATSSDLAELRLWRDDGDGAFEASDDVDLGPLTPIDDRWQTTLLDEPLGGGTSTRFFVGATVAQAPTDSVTLRLQIPTGGITVESGNDGPLYQVIEAPRTRLLSSAPLLVSMEFDRSTSVVSESVEARMIVRNVGSEDILAIEPSPLELTANGTLAVVSGPSPATIDLAFGAVDTFRWSLESVGSGEVQVRGSAAGDGADSGLERRALPSSSPGHRAYLEASSLGLHPAPAAPSMVAQGQVDVVPFTLTFDHAAPSEVSDIEIESLLLRFEDEQERAVDVEDLLASLEVSEGTNRYATVESFTAGDSLVSVLFDPPVRVTTSEPVTLSVQLALSAVTVVREYQVCLESAASVIARDANSGRPVVISLQSGEFPIHSGLATVRAEVTELQLETQPVVPPRVAPGTGAVPLLVLRGENPGVGDLTGDVEVETLEIEILDASGAGAPASAALLSRIRVLSPGLVAADLPVPASADSLLVVDLSPRIRIPVGSPLEIRIEADLREELEPTTLRARLRSSGVRALDSTARDPVPVVAPTDPLEGELVTVENAATDARLGAVAGIAPTTIIGETAVEALRFTLRHPGGAGTGAVRVDSLRLAARDQLRSPLPLATVLDRLSVQRADTVVSTVTDLGGVGDAVDLALGGLTIDAGQVMELAVRIDVEASAPDTFLELWVPTASVVAVDANSGQRLELQAEAGTDLPLSSGLSQLRAPARELTVAMDSSAPAIVVPGAKDVGFASLTLANPSTSDATPIDVERISFSHLGPGEQRRPAAESLARLRLVDDETVLAEGSGASLDSSRVELILDPPLSVPPGEERRLSLRADLAEELAIEGIVLELADGDVRVNQPTSALLSIDVVAAPGLDFPFRTESANVSRVGLAESFSNFPNPFAAGRGETTFAFHLRGEAEVTLRIFTVLGERVITLLDEASRPPGLHQDEIWDGRNGGGEVVRNGVYLARIEVRYGDGSTEHIMRKVAVRR